MKFDEDLKQHQWITKMYTCIMHCPVKMTKLRALEYGMGCGAW